MQSYKKKKKKKKKKKICTVKPNAVTVFGTISLFHARIPAQPPRARDGGGAIRAGGQR